MRNCILRWGETPSSPHFIPLRAGGAGGSPPPRSFWRAGSRPNLLAGGAGRGGRGGPGPALYLFWDGWPLRDAVVDDFQNLLPFLAHQRQTRRADPFDAQAAFLHRQLDVLHELRVDVEVQQRREPPVNFARHFPFATARQVPEV